MANLVLQHAGNEFNTAVALLEGGVTASNQETIMHDLEQVQNNLNQAIKAGEADGTFTGLSAIHIQNVDDQLTLDMHTLDTIGSVATAPKEVNDIQLDIVDIVQGDPTLLAQAGTGFAMYPLKLEPNAPFVDNQAQTSFLAQFQTDSNTLGTDAVNLVSANPGQPGGTAGAALVQHIETYLTNANAFDVSQGGIFAARFDNELTTNGVVGTDARALIDGIDHGNLAETQAAAAALAQNASDVNGNNVPLGTTPPVIPSGIPTTFTSFGQVGTVFNDATTKLIGGIYHSGTSTNSTSVLADLNAVDSGLQQVTTADPGAFNAKALADITKMEKLINTEITAINSVGTDPNAAQHIHHDDLAILNIVQNDPTLKALAAADNGFTALPGAEPGHNGADAIPVAQDPHQHGTQIASNDWMFNHH
jgi:hypothetical protein